MIKVGSLVIDLFTLLNENRADVFMIYVMIGSALCLDQVM